MNKTKLTLIIAKVLVGVYVLLNIASFVFWNADQGDVSIVLDIVSIFVISVAVITSIIGIVLRKIEKDEQMQEDVNVGVECEDK